MMKQKQPETVNKMAYSVEEAALQTSMSKSSIRNAIRDKSLKARHLGRRVVILHDDLQAYLEGEVKAASGMEK